MRRRKWISQDGYQEMVTRQCTVTLEQRPSYCDRGRFLAKLWPIGEFAREIDGQDGWPRYYYDEDRAKLEIEAWLDQRKAVQ